MAKLKANEKRVQLSFQRPEDVALFERLTAMAYDRRYELGTFIILSLQEAFRVEEPVISVREKVLREIESDKDAESQKALPE
jgi:hypothetical protein